MKSPNSKAFRVSREEPARIELLANIAGVSQQGSIMTKLEDIEFTVVVELRTCKIRRDSIRDVLCARSSADYETGRISMRG